MQDTHLTGLARSPDQLGKLIRKARLARGMSQSALAQRAGMHQPMISTIERGHPGTSLAAIFDLMAVLDLEVTVRARSKSSAADIASIF